MKTWKSFSLVGIFLLGQGAALYAFTPDGWYHGHKQEARTQGYFDGFDDGVQGAADRISLYRALFRGDYDEGYTRGLRAGGGYRRT